MKVTGGGNVLEDVAGGLNCVTKLDWKSSTRLVIHIADVPCHWRMYHDNHPVQLHAKPGLV
jgi:hypothetical protein